MKAGLAVMFMAGAALAQPAFDIAPTTTCLKAQGQESDLMACIGAAAEACIEADYSTVGMGYCLEQEWLWWDDQLNLAYGKAMADAKAADADLPEPLNVQAQTLQDMQRAWIPFRDALCAWEAAQWQGGTGAGPAQIGCLMQETARQAVSLQSQGLGH